MILKLLLNTFLDSIFQYFYKYHPYHLWMIFIKNIEEYYANKKIKILIAFGDIIADMLSNKNVNPIVAEIYIRARKLNCSLAFITQSYFSVPKYIRLNSRFYF